MESEQLCDELIRLETHYSQEYISRYRNTLIENYIAYSKVRISDECFTNDLRRHLKLVRLKLFTFVYFCKLVVNSSHEQNLLGASILQKNGQSQYSITMITLRHLNYDSGSQTDKYQNSQLTIYFSISTIINENSSAIL